MLNVRLIRERPDVVRAALARRHQDVPLDAVLALDERRRALLQELEGLRAQINELSRRVGHLRQRDPQAAEAARNESRALGTRVRELEEEVTQVERDLEAQLAWLPNLPADDVPDGADERDNVVVRTWGEPRRHAFTPRPHWELGERLGIIDFERGVKLAGTRFYVLRGAGAMLQRALIAWMLDLHRHEHGYVEIYPPYLVREEIVYGSGQLPKFADNLYRDIADDLWLIPTAEVPLVNLHRDEILEPDALPINYVAHTPCFRREKMAAGRDTRGIKRGHQFDKVELVKIVAPETSDEELARLVSHAEEVLRRLELPYRVVQLCTGDLGFTAVKTFDLEVWAPGCAEWLEVSSCSNVGDFQSRRANIRWRRAIGARVEYPHALNGSALALPRTVIAVLETYQRADGSVEVPAVLRPYMGGIAMLEPH
jgi:seryl-tRNA synthetase